MMRLSKSSSSPARLRSRGSDVLGRYRVPRPASRKLKNQAGR
jgi:hypothetical protein